MYVPLNLNFIVDSCNVRVRFERFFNGLVHVKRRIEKVQLVKRVVCKNGNVNVGFVKRSSLIELSPFPAPAIRPNCINNAQILALLLVQLIRYGLEAVAIFTVVRNKASSVHA